MVSVGGLGQQDVAARLAVLIAGVVGVELSVGDHVHRQEPEPVARGLGDPHVSDARTGRRGHA